MHSLLCEYLKRKQEDKARNKKYKSYKRYDSIEFNEIKEPLFRHLVIARLAFPLSKLKTIEYLYRYQGIMHDKDAVIRFLDKLNTNLKEHVEQIAFAHTIKVSWKSRHRFLLRDHPLF